MAKITRRTNINANVDPTIAPALEDVGSVSMLTKHYMHFICMCKVNLRCALFGIFSAIVDEGIGGTRQLLFEDQIVTVLLLLVPLCAQ